MLYPGEEPQPASTDNPNTCPACEWAWRLFGEQACDAHDDLLDARRATRRTDHSR